MRVSQLALRNLQTSSRGSLLHFWWWGNV